MINCDGLLLIGINWDDYIVSPAAENAAKLVLENQS